VAKATVKWKGNKPAAKTAVKINVEHPKKVRVHEKSIDK
jgi:hypothetical protein